jgi:murein DD-endopeptidase MepM/ murein hydrolase activator NlpD
MQIILFSRASTLPRTFDLTATRMRWRAGVLLASAVSACMIAGAVLALSLASPRGRALAQVEALKQQVRRQDTQLATMKQTAQRDIDALAIRLGQLQSQSARLDALGERLVEAGKLDAREFDFEHDPPVGGIEEATDGTSYALPQTLTAGIDQLARRFDAQQAELVALQSLLLDARIDSGLKPSGMPVQGYISSYFGGRPDPFSGHHARHTGIDIAADRGMHMHAVAEGMVTYAGVRNGYGNVVEIDHGNGYMTRYAHASVLLVHMGQRVHLGDVIAEVGSSGRSTGPHVHFEVWYQGRAMNPLAYVRDRH